MTFLGSPFKVEQLDDGMVFYLSSLPKESFDVIKQIYHMFVEAELKSQKVPRSKEGTMAKLLGLKRKPVQVFKGT